MKNYFLHLHQTLSIRPAFLAIAISSPLLIGGCATAESKKIPAPNYVTNYSEKLPCVSRIGRCFDATIGGKPVSVIADKAQFENLKHQLKELNDNVHDVYWVVDGTVEGSVALEVETTPNALGAKPVGPAIDSPDVTVYELDDQGLESKSEFVSNDSVKINGQPIVTKQETLTQDYLPPGRYVFAIKHRGQFNWDRKWVMVTVK
jgi:hypothetical protein